MGGCQTFFHVLHPLFGLTRPPFTWIWAHYDSGVTFVVFQEVNKQHLRPATDSSASIHHKTLNPPTIRKTAGSLGVPNSLKTIHCLSSGNPSHLHNYTKFGPEFTFLFTPKTVRNGDLDRRRPTVQKQTVCCGY